MAKKQNKSPAQLHQEMVKSIARGKEEFSEFEAREFEKSSEDGGINIVVTGKREIKSITISDEYFGLKKDDLASEIKSLINDVLVAVREENTKFTTQYSARINALISSAT